MTKRTYTARASERAAGLTGHRAGRQRRDASGTHPTEILTRRRSMCVIGIVLVSLVHAGSAHGQRPDVIVAARYLATDGTLQPKVAIVLSDGKIKKVVSAEEYESASGSIGQSPSTGRSPVVRYDGGVVCPGLIDVRGRLGAFGKNFETFEAIDPSASASASLDPRHRDFRAALRAGITTVMIAPQPNNLVSGVAVVVKTAGAQNAAGRILRDGGPLMFALGSTVFMADRAPTSRIGALSMLRDAIAAAKGGRGPERLIDFVKGRLDGVVVCDEPMDVDAALRLFADLPSSLAIVHSGDAHDLAPSLASAGRAIVVGPYGFDTDSRTISAAGAFASAGVPVAFAGGYPVAPAAALRITASLAVRYGMDPAKARLGMTKVPADIAGVSDRVGAIAPGMDADMVVFSDDPLRLDARVLAVYISGVRVYDADLDGAGYRGGLQ